MFTSKHILVLLIGLLTCFTSYTQTELFSHRVYKSADGDSLLYRQLEFDIDPLTRHPLVIFLHGSGERGNDNEAQLKWGVQNFASDAIMKTYRPIVLAPQCPSGQAWANYLFTERSIQDTPTRQMQLLRELIDEVMDTYPVDTNRIYITGLSMGGFGTFDAITRYPDLFAAAVPVCGGGDASQAAAIANIPIWIFHGANDEAVAPDFSISMLRALNEAGARPGFTLYPETAHFSWLAAYSDPMMMDWLFRQRK